MDLVAANAIFVLTMSSVFNICKIPGIRAAKVVRGLGTTSVFLLLVVQTT